MKCPYCGRNIADNSVVCIFCEKMLQTPSRPVFQIPETGNNQPNSESSKIIQDTGRIYLPPNSGVPPYAPAPGTHARTVPSSHIEDTDYFGSSLHDPPLSIGGFIGTLIVSYLPIAGLIVLLVWICRAKTNANRRNLSVALLIVKLICMFFFCGAALAFYLLKSPFFYYFW